MNRRTAAFLCSFLLLAPAVRDAAAQSPSKPALLNADLFAQSVKAAQETIGEFMRWDNPAEEARVHRIGYELAQQCEYQKYPFTFTLLDVAVPNAMALPGGQIFVTRGMLDLGLDDDMLANILGHEIGHVIREHNQRLQRRATVMSVLSNVLMVGAVIGAERSRSTPSGPQAPYDPRYDYGIGGYGDGHGNLIEGAAVTSLVLSELLLRSYGREYEDEADFEGQRLAAAAGYDPDGARRVWAKMNSRAPQIKEYGYLQTHPFDDARLRSAAAREKNWKIAPRLSPDDYRASTQGLLLDFAAQHKWKEKEKPAPTRRPPPSAPPNEVAEALRHRVPSANEFLKVEALAAWPKGPAAGALRLEKLREQRTGELTKPLNTRDYGVVIKAYRQQMEEVRRLDPRNTILPVLETETAELETKCKESYPQAAQVLSTGVYETPFLVAFLSNYPTAREVPQVALALGDGFSRTGKEADAVAQYLTAWKAGPESAEGKRARTGLRLLAPNLKDLTALERLAEQDQDPELRHLAADRLAAIAKSFDDLANGAEYLRRFPEGEQVVAVLDRLNVLADNLYGEVVLYQGVGDAARAIDRINKILTNAPLSPAAERLRDRAVLTAAKSG
jgi:Zn-dependent protease with chaperone function